MSLIIISDSLPSLASPSYSPLWIFWWQNLQTGICFLFILDIRLLMKSAFVFVSCFRKWRRWCISTWLSCSHRMQNGSISFLERQPRITRASMLSVGLKSRYTWARFNGRAYEGVGYSATVSPPGPSIFKSNPNFLITLAFVFRRSLLAKVRMQLYLRI